MKKVPILRRLMALLLVLVLFGSLVPAALAAENTDGLSSETTQSVTDPPEETTPAETPNPTEETGATDPTVPAAAPTEPEETVPNTEATEPTVPSTEPQSAEPTAPAEEPQETVPDTTEPTVPEETVNPTEPAATESEADPAEDDSELISTLSLDATSTKAVTWAQMALAEVTSGHSYSFEFNGKTISHRDYMLIGIDSNHDGVFSYTEAVYCIEPGDLVDRSYQYFSSEYTGTSDAWGSLGAAKQRAIGLALLYGFPNGLVNTSSDSATQDKYNATYQLATAIIVHELCIGYRSATAPYTCTNTGFFDFYYEEDLKWVPDYLCRTYKGVGSTAVDKALLKEAYDYISDKMAKHRSTLSFANISTANVPTYQMTRNSNGTYSVTLTDTNGVLADYVFPTISGVTFAKSGNTLTITASSASAIPTTVIAPTRSVPSPDNSAYIVWNGGSDGQQLLSLKAQGSDDPVPAYFKLEQATGDLTVKKTSTYGAGSSQQFSFRIYCPDGTYLDRTLKVGESVTLTDLQLGTYTVGEWFTSGWECTNAQATTVDQSRWVVDVTAGGNVTVTANNEPLGSLTVKKTSSNSAIGTGSFRVSVYNSSLALIADKTIKVGDSFTLTDLKLGEYYVREWNADGWICTTTALTTDSASAWFSVTVKGGEATVTINNDLSYGKIKLVKTMDTDGPLAGWQFKITDSTGAEVTGSPFTTDEGGNIDISSLLPGDYTVEEIFPDGSPFYCKSENPQTVTVKAGETAQVSFTNALRPGQISIEKVNFLGQNLAGAKFLLEWSTDGTTWTPVTYSDKEDVVLGGCTSEDLTDGCLVTGADGIITFVGLYPSWGDTAVQYRLTEVEAPEGYQLLADYAFTGELPVDEDLTINLTVYNSSGYTLPSTAGIIGPELLGALGTILAMLALALAVTLPVIHSINGKKRR